MLKNKDFINKIHLKFNVENRLEIIFRYNPESLFYNPKKPSFTV